jgi:hypothetical protein
MPRDPIISSANLASTEDIRAILGALNETDLLQIAALQPTIRDVEEAATCLSGDRDVFGAGEPLKGIAAEIVTVLAPDEDDEAQRRR